MNQIHLSGQNRLLALLPTEERSRVLARCEKVSFQHRTIVYEADGPIEEVYFPLSGIVSLVMSSSEGETVEVGMVGNEGMVGTPLLLGANRSPTEAIVQVSIEGLRMRREELEEELALGDGLASLCQRYAQALTNQVMQSVLCNRLHSVDERLCRWFLMTHDRAGTDEIVITQHFVAQMLGVHRPSVTIAIGVLQKAGFVSYSRGRLRILDRPGLEEGACECYANVREDTERLLRTRTNGTLANRPGPGTVTKMPDMATPTTRQRGEKI
ncbi:MAG: Crp/Fnr family transcriptional regulator [Burkholderiales bacterium]